MIYPIGFAEGWGYAYRYRFAIDDSIIHLYKERQPAKSSKSLLFEIRTTFKIQGRDGVEEVMDSERFDVFANDALCLEFFMFVRAKSYWMSERRLRNFTKAAHAYGVAAAHSDGVIPVVAYLDVVTVQQEDEELASTMQRSITATKLLPVFVEVFDTTLDVDLRDWEKNLRDNWKMCVIVDKVKDLETALDMMELCPLCSHPPALGSHVSELDCGHVFHSHCLFNFVHRNRELLCPQCGSYARSPFCNRIRVIVPQWGCHNIMKVD